MATNSPITGDVLREIMPAVGANGDIYAGVIEAAMQEFGITTLPRRAAFLAQILHETGGLKRMSENLNYTPEALMSTFNTKTNERFHPNTAKMYGRTDDHRANQMMIANIAYANRYGNGDSSTGDGWKYRGRGLIQTTFKDNYAACAKSLRLDLINHPELLEQPSGAARSAGFFWLSNGLNALADAEKIVDICKRVNGGKNGLAERVELFRRAKAALA